MAVFGALKTPEPKADAIARAEKIHGRARANFAFFFIGGRLSACQADKEKFDETVHRYRSSLVGVYERSIDFRSVIDDIDEYYRKFSM